MCSKYNDRDGGETNMKRKVAAVLSLGLTLSLAASPVSAASQNSFDSVEVESQSITESVEVAMESEEAEVPASEESGAEEDETVAPIADEADGSEVVDTEDAEEESSAFASEEVMDTDQISIPIQSEEVLVGASTKFPKPSYNLSQSLITTSYMVKTDRGCARIAVDKDAKQLLIEEYTFHNGQFELQLTRSIPYELDIWGGFYEGKDAYYLITGKDNKAEDDHAEIIRVVRYDKNWNRIGAASITGNPDMFGGEVRYPFDVGCVNTAEVNGSLYIVTGHEGYVDPEYNQGHQGFLMVQVDEKSMKGKIVKADLWHSFSQYIATDGNDLYTAEESEGSEAEVVTRYSTSLLSGSENYFTAFEHVQPLKYGGSRTSAWAVATRASVNGIEVSDDHVFTVGTSIDQSKYNDSEYNSTYNLYLSITPKDHFSTEATKVVWLTKHLNNRNQVSPVHLVKMNQNRFAVIWSESSDQSEKRTDANDLLSGRKSHFLLLDGSGNPISREYIVDGALSDCKPVVIGDELVYFASNGNTIDFYRCNPANGSVSQQVFNVAGSNASWFYKDGTLFIKGEGAIDSRAQDYWRGERYGWLEIRDEIKKLDIPKGITSLPEEVFAGLNHVETLILPDTITSIGDRAFAYNGSLRAVVIPKSVKSIGKDIVWTGSYWVSDESHVTYATIYGAAGSTAESYAKQNHIRFETLAAFYHADGKNPYNHKTELRNKKDATTSSTGYTGDLYCNDCGETLTKGSVIPKIEVPKKDDQSKQNGKQSMYRLYNPNSGEHFYTANVAEKNRLSKIGWNYEGIGWTAPKTSKTPVYRLYNPNAGDHHYTINRAERDSLIKVGWRAEGIGWYSDDQKEKPLYRQYNPNAISGSHNYTINKKENDYLVSVGWRAEGIGWYGVSDSKKK